MKINFAPINTGFFQDGDFTPEIFKFHGLRSGNGIHASYLGNVAVDRILTTNARTPYFTSQNVKSFQRIANVILENGSLPAIQIAARSDLDPAKIRWRGLKVEDYITHTHTQIKLDTYDISGVAEKFIQSSVRSIDSGFKIIQIHAAHGYLLSNLLSPTLNPFYDDDDIGGISIIDQIVGGIRNYAKDIKIDLRYSVIDPVDLDKTDVILDLLSLDIDILSFSAGIYDIDKTQIYPNANLPQLPNLDAAKKFLPYGKEINVCGNITRIDNLPEIDNLSFSIGRNLIANPRFIIDSKAHCEFRNKCHYYSRGAKHIECPIPDDLRPNEY